MQTVEIPRKAWAQTLNEFTAIHEGWLVSLDVLGPTIGAQPEINNLPLLGVLADRVDHDGLEIDSELEDLKCGFFHYLWEKLHT